jgi:hypothetical protein
MYYAAPPVAVRLVEGREITLAEDVWAYVTPAAKAVLARSSRAIYWHKADRVFRLVLESLATDARQRHSARRRDAAGVHAAWRRVAGRRGARRMTWLALLAIAGHLLHVLVIVCFDAPISRYTEFIVVIDLFVLTCAVLRELRGVRMSSAVPSRADAPAMSAADGAVTAGQPERALTLAPALRPMKSRFDAPPT